MVGGRIGGQTVAFKAEILDELSELGRRFQQRVGAVFGEVTGVRLGVDRTARSGSGFIHHAGDASLPQSKGRRQTGDARPDDGDRGGGGRVGAGVHGGSSFERNDCG